MATYEYAHSAAWDAGTRSAFAAGRERWADEDWSAAAAAFSRLHRALADCRMVAGLVAEYDALTGAPPSDGGRPSEHHVTGRNR